MTVRLVVNNDLTFVSVDGNQNNVLLVPELVFMTGLTDEQRNNFKLGQALATWTR